MISIIKSTDDSYAMYGIEHFFRKFGIMIDNKEPKIVIRYGNNEKGNEKFSIFVMDNSINSEVIGNIEYKGDKAPLFEEASKTGQRAGYIRI